MRIFFLCILMIPALVTAQLKVAKIFSDNMVLQRDKPVHIWGKAIPGHKVTVEFAEDKVSTTAQKDSSWSVVFKKQRANTQSQSVTIISGHEKIELKNILIGDIWLGIGQSNMEWPMMKEMHYKEEVVNSYQPLLRFYNPTYAGKNTFNVSFTDSIIKNLSAENFYKGQWQTCDSSSFKTMSAVAYYFGKTIVNEINVPIALINLSIGGAPLETFISTETLKNSSQFAKKIQGNWLINNALPVWARERGKQNIGRLTNLTNDANGNNHPFKPGFAYRSGIEPILAMPIKGVICYQGESNAQEIERVKEYAALFALMIKDYRLKWKQPELPFYYVQLSSIDSVQYKSQLWPQFRDEQRKMLQLIPNAGMAVCSDIGFKNDVHPTNKKEVGERLARWVLFNTGKKNIIPSGPMPFQARYENGKISISFHYAGNKLVTADGNTVHGFSIDGINECEAFIQQKKIIITIKEKPEFIYYGWQPFSIGNLLNADKLPASTFKLNVK